MTGMTNPDWVEWTASTLASAMLWAVLGTQVRTVMARQSQMQRFTNRRIEQR